MSNADTTSTPETPGPPVRNAAHAATDEQTTVGEHPAEPTAAQPCGKPFAGLRQSRSP